MFNPFAPFEARFLQGFKQKGVKAFIKQSYKRGMNLLESDPVPAYILQHTDDVGLAQEHYDAIRHDPGRQLFILNDPIDYANLEKLVTSKSVRCYTMLKVKDAELKAQKLLDKRIRAYVKDVLNWYLPSWDQLKFSLDLVYGELYVKLAWGAREVKVKMDEIENLKGHVL